MGEAVLQIVEYIHEGKSAFAAWFNSLDASAAAKVTTAIYKLEQGNITNVKSVGSGVMEYRIDFGPGYRIYFGRVGDKLIILIGGGSKKKQRIDINNAQAAWKQYKSDKNKRR